MNRSLNLVWAVFITCFFSSGCGLVTRYGIKHLYKPAPLPKAQIIQDISYGSDPLQGLDLFLPQGQGWPTLIFVHGGGWTEGDKRLQMAGADVYGNIGRFYAGQWIGVAVINYRLLPKVAWEDQVNDVAAAIAWVRANIEKYGGNPDCLFVSGHSAGAHLASYTVLQTELLEEMGVPRPAIRGVIAVSGAGLDLEDQLTYKMGEDPAYYERRFGGSPDWKKLASPVTFVRRGVPPFLILHAGKEKKTLKRQSLLLHQALRKSRVRSNIIVVPGESHSRIVLTLSRPDKTAGPAIVAFIKKWKCR